MIRTSNYTNLTASITGRGKRGLFALGEVAQKKLYTAEYVPSSAGEPGLIFTLLPLPLAAAGFPLSLPGMAHSATVGGGHHRHTGNCKPSHRHVTWAISACSTRSPVRPQSQNLMKPLRKVNYGPQCRQGTKERRP